MVYPYNWEFNDPPTALTPVSAMVAVSTDPGVAQTPVPQTEPVIQQGTVDPLPGGTATFAPVAKTKEPSKNTGPTSSPNSPPNPGPPSNPETSSSAGPPSNTEPSSNPETPLNAGPPSKANSPSNIDPPSNAEPPPNEDSRPSIPQSNPAEDTTRTRTEVLASKVVTQNPPRTSFPIATVGSQQIYALPAGGVAVQGKTVKLDDPAVTVDGMPISVGLESVYIGGSAFKIPSPIPALGPLPSTLDGEPIGPITAGAVVFGEQIISEGQLTTVYGYQVSNGQDRIVIASTTFAKSQGGGLVPAPGPTPPTMLNGKYIASATAGGLLFDGQMISEGQEMTVDGHGIFNKHDRIIIDGTTFEKPRVSIHPPTNGPTPLPPAIGGKSLRYEEDGALVLKSKTIFPGQQTTIDGKGISMKTDEVVVDGKTYAVPVAGQPTTSKAPSPSFRLNEDGALVYDGKMISSGQQTTINGKHVVIKSSEVVIDSTTYPFSNLPHPTADPASLLTQINGEEVRFDAEGKVVLGGSTMNLEQQTTVQGMYISAGHGRAIVGSHTYSAPSTGNALRGTGFAQTDMLGGSEASLTNPTLTGPGAAATGQADHGPTPSASGQNSPNGETGLGAIILSAMEDTSQKSAGASSPAVESHTPTVIPGVAYSPSSNSVVEAASSFSLWFCSAVTGLAILVL
ncbi:MAG: hypothetical protein Q9212_004566 [Teloschistes hypoglaucus]